MSRPPSRTPSAAVVPRREQKSSSRAPSTIPAFDTQPERYKLDESEEIPWSVVPNTPNRISGRRHITKSQNVQTISSTSASPTQHSVEQSKRTENHQKRQSATPQAEIPDGQSSQDDTPPKELITAQRDLLDLWTKTKGWSHPVVLKGVIEALTDYFPELNESTQPTQSTTGLENNGSALTPNDIGGCQHGSRSSGDATGNMLLRQENTSRLSTPDGEDLAEQVAALPVNKKPKSATTRLNRTDLTSVRISNEREFRKHFRKYGLDKITVGESEINLLDLARETVEDVKPKFQERQRELGEVWQVLFTIIANMFVCGPEPLYHTVKALSKQSSTDSNGHHRRNRRGSNDAVDGPLSKDALFKVIHKEELEELVDTVRWWWAKENKSQTQLEKVYANYKKLETVRQYDAMMSSWLENEGIIQKFLRRRVGERQDPAHYILSYIWHRITESRGNKTFTLLPKKSTKLKKLSDSIFGFRSIFSLVDTFGEGVLLLLVDNAVKYVPGKVEEGQQHYPQHERIRDVALSLCEVDRINHDGQLRQLFTDLDEEVLSRIVQLFEGGNTGSLLYDCPRRDYFFNELDVGKRISHILMRISDKESTESGSDTSESTEAGSDVITTRETRARTRSSKRSMEGAVDGEQGTGKRQRTGSGEDEESSDDGSESSTDSEEDLYLP